MTVAFNMICLMFSQAPLTIFICYCQILSRQNELLNELTEEKKQVRKKKKLIRCGGFIGGFCRPLSLRLLNDLLGWS